MGFAIRKTAMGALSALTWFLPNMSAVAATHTLFYDGYSVELTDGKKTSPALHIRLHTDEMTYGALYDTPAPEHSLHIRHNGIEYWVGKWCDAGTYLTEAKECAECGYGHYCPGGVARGACSGGAIACNSKNESMNKTVDSSLLNRFLTMDQAAQYLPVTNMSDWVQVTCCDARVDVKYRDDVINDLSLLHKDDIGGCPIQVAEPGTYMFFSQNAASDACCRPANNRCTSENFYAAHATVAVFDHAVSYKIVHANNIFGVFVDLQSVNFKSHDIASEYDGRTNMCIGMNYANVGDIIDIVHTGSDDAKIMCMYRLK